MKQKFLFVILFLGAIAPVFADDECPRGYGVAYSFVPTGINLFNKDSADLLPVGQYVEVDGRFIKSGIAKDYSIKKYLNAGTYTITREIGEHKQRLRCVTFDSEPIVETSVGVDIGGMALDATSGTFTLADDSWVVIWIASSNGGATDEEITNAVNTCMLVKDDVVPTTYIPYGYMLPQIGECTLCPPNTYKDSVGNTDCIPCPIGLMSPSGATSIDECGRILHVGDYNVYMPVGRRTEHGLCTMLNGVKYCADVYERE